MKRKYSLSYSVLSSIIIPALLLVAISVVISGQSFADEQVIEHGEDPATGLKYWLWDNNGFYLKLTQRLPDQTRAYFEARGFDQASAEITATSCIFQSMIKNTGKDSGVLINADLSEWKVVSGEGSKSMLLRE